MMSFRAVHAGSGYQYLLRSVATNDASSSTVEEGKLSNYYQAKGTPAGRWIGKGLQGLQSETAAMGVEIEADQMEALYGLGYHPDAHQMLREGVKLEDCKLGGKFPIYTNEIPVLDELRSAERALVKETGRLLTVEERSDLAVSIGRKHYVSATGYEYSSDKDVIDWVNQQRDQVKQAVAGFDLTFSPAKSVSVLWALADEHTASRIAACHHEAVAEVLAWAEEHTVRTRMGAGGLAQVKTRGIIASEFTHFDTRAGDPDLHSHVLVSNKVQGPDGKWRTLDSRAMFKNHQTLSARYDTVLQDILTRKMGLAFEASPRESGKEPVWEVAGVPQELIDLFSKRRALARPVYDRLVADFVDRHGHQPDKRTQMQLWQAAILDTRDAKRPAESLATLRAGWRDSVDRLDNSQALLSALNGVLDGQGHDLRPEFFVGGDVFEQDLDDRASEVIDRLVQKRSYFARHHITAAVGSYLKGFRFDDEGQSDRAMDLLTERIVDFHMVGITPQRDLVLPASMRNEDGMAVDHHLDYAKYTTPEILAQEDAVLAAVSEPVAVFADSQAVSSALTNFEASRGFSLNAGQSALAQHLVQSGTLVACGVGPAGTGKTTAMQVAADAWVTQGHSVIGLAPSAQAADVLGDELGINASTIDSLTHIWRGRHPVKPAGDLSALPIDIQPGDMLLVDEAGMATTDNLAALTEIAQQSGAVLRLIGDPEQLDAVGTGGLFATMCRYSDAAELTEVMRFEHGNDTAQADASLALRRGDTDAVDFYDQRHWLAGGTRETMLSQAVESYLADTERGRNSLIVATTNTDVDALNEMIRAHRIDHGEVDTHREVELSRNDRAGVGDVIIARKNARLANPHDADAPGPRVINGQMFRITGLNDDGSVTATDTATGHLYYLPADYVGANTHLGYAATVYRSQGATVDTTHAVVDAATSRSSLYVALTRGKHENRIYAVTDDFLDELAEEGHEHSAGNTPGLSARDVVCRAIARDNRQRSATDIRTEAEQYATSRERLEKLYRYGLDMATADFIDRQLDGWWDALDADAADTLTDEGRQKVRAAWRDVLARGVDPRDLMPTAVFNLGGAEEAGAVIAWRLRNEVDLTGARPDDVGLRPPVTRGAD
ncbi:relaxase domain-containing protein, partial [Corynebacterium sp. CCUG 69979]|uniref:MobF family relaxase n=1 Tax=Corynebacterium sp. CCUG 69979 TaxID=2823890 RepID=UPI00210C87CA